MNLKNETYYILRYYQNDILINLRVLEKKGIDFEEIFPDEIKDGRTENLLPLVNDNSNLTPLKAEEVKKLDAKLNQYMNIAKTLIGKSFKLESENREFKQMDEIGGNIYLITKNKETFYSEIFSVRLKENGYKPTIFLINQDFAELGVIDHISQIITDKKPEYIKLNDIFYIGAIRSTFKGQSCVSIGIIEFLGDNLSCNKAYLLEANSKGKYEPLSVEKFNNEVSDALKVDIGILCETFISSLIS